MTLATKSLMALIVFLVSFHSGAITVTDDANRTLTMKQPAQRIVSLAPHITELLFAAGAGAKIVGTVNYSDYPPEAKNIPMVGGYNQVNFEAILGLNPDLIIAWKNGNSRETLDQLASLRIPIFMSDPKGFSSIARNIRALGIITANEKVAEANAARFERRLGKLIQRHADSLPITVFYQVWDQPLYTLAGGHFSKDLYQICGGKNVFQDINEPSPVVSFESVVARNPQVMLTGGQHGKRSLKHWRQTWATWSSIDAVKHGQMFLVNQDIYTRASPRILDAAEDRCAILNSARQVYYPTSSKAENTSKQIE